MGGRMDGRVWEEAVIYIDHLQLVENEQNKREKMAVCVLSTVHCT